MPEELRGQRLILKSGITIEDGSAGYADGYLWCWFTGMTLPVAASMFFDPANTSVIRYQYGEMEDRYEGYTDCVHMDINAYGQVSICLKKGESSNV